MRKIEADDMFLISEIADKMDLQMPEVKGKTQEQLGGELIMLMFKKLHKAQAEVATLVERVTGKNIKGMPLDELLATLKDLMKQEGVVSFFKPSAK